MFPILQKGSTVTLETVTADRIKNGDIIAYNQKGKRDVIFRKCFFVDETKTKMNLIAINSLYDSETIGLDSLNILGKVKKVIFII